MTDSALRQRKGKENELPKEQKKSQEEVMDVLKQFQDKMREALILKAREDLPQGTSEGAITDSADKELEKMFTPKTPPLPGLKNETKKAKDKLAEDPYNLELIFELGEQYLLEEKYPEAANVLVRGWKRMSEFESPEMRFVFLHCLCHASYTIKKYKQALAVLMDMEEPEDPEASLQYFEIACKVYGQNDNLQKCLKAFHDALAKSKKGGFEAAIRVYGRCNKDLKKVGALEAAKSSVEQLAESEDDKKKLHILETFSVLKVAIDEPPSASQRTNYIVIGAALVAMIFVVYCLHLLEGRSLKSLNLNK